MNTSFFKCGKNSLISNWSLCQSENLQLGDNVRIDPFSYITGKVKIGNYVHIPPFTVLSGGDRGIEIGNCVTISPGVKIFTVSADYKNGLTNPTIPQSFRKSIRGSIHIDDFVCLFANTVVLPETWLRQGSVFLANSVITKGIYGSWSIFHGTPAKFKKDRDSKPILSAYEKLKAS